MLCFLLTYSLSSCKYLHSFSMRLPVSAILKVSHLRLDLLMSGMLKFLLYSQCLVLWASRPVIGPYWYNLGFFSSDNCGGSVVWRVEFSRPTSEATGLNLGPGTSCWKVGSYLPMPGGLQCSMPWFPLPVNYPSQYDWLLNAT